MLVHIHPKVFLGQHMELLGAIKLYSTLHSKGCRELFGNVGDVVGDVVGHLGWGWGWGWGWE